MTNKQKQEECRNKIESLGLICRECKNKITPRDNETYHEAKDRKFCSQACAASFNNKLYPKRIKRKYLCEMCGDETLAQRRFCKPCSLVRKTHPVVNGKKDPNGIKIDDKTKGFVYGTFGCHGGASRVRGRARKLVARLVESGIIQYQCFVCGYNIHVEACHIKPLKDFCDDSMLNEINHPDNLVLLCRNHHWEVEHGIINL